MKKFLFKVFIYSLPLLGFILFVLFYDPFNMFRLKWFSGSEGLNNVAHLSDFGLSQALKFNTAPDDKYIVLLGDSRAYFLNADSIFRDRKKDNSIMNLSVHGSNLHEIYDMFWFAVKTHQIKEVYIGLNYGMFSDFTSRNRVKDAQKILEHRYRYFFHKPVLLSIYRYYKWDFLKKNDFISPATTSGEHWRYMIDVAANNAYKNHKETPQLWAEFKSIADYCKKNHIRLVLFSPPTHVDLQRVVSRFGQEKDLQDWKKKISAIAPFVDFDVENAFTSDPKYFRDPYHLSREGLRTFEMQFRRELADSSGK